MIAVITRYFPHKTSFELVLQAVTVLANDEEGKRKGCFETRLFSSEQASEIKSVSLWEDQQVFEEYLDRVIDSEELMEFQATHLRHEITTQIYDTVDTISGAPDYPDMQMRKHGT